MIIETIILMIVFTTTALRGGGVESNQHLSVHILALLIDFAIIVNIDISTTNITTITTMMI